VTRRALAAAALGGPFLSCRRQELAMGDDDGSLERFPIAGVVTRVDPALAVVTIKHGPITKANGELWMEAMTMDFPVSRREAMPKANPGQAIQATVVTRKSDFAYWIEHIQLK